MTLKECVLEYYLHQNYNCAESLIRGGNDYYGLGLHDRDMIMMGAYGGGIQTGSTCGTLLSAASILSMKYVEAKAHESADIKPVVTLLTRYFKEETEGNVLCKDIKARFFRPEVRCLRTVEMACEVLEKVIAEYEQKRSGH